MICCVVFVISLGLVFARMPIYDRPSYQDLCHDDVCRSPINLISNPYPFIHAPIHYRNYFNGFFNRHFNGAIMNTGATVVWTINSKHHFKLTGDKQWRSKNPNVRYGPFDGKPHSHVYYFWKAEFRWGEPGNPYKGSEHTIDGKRYALEMQMVHIEDNFVEPDGSLKLVEARGSKQGIAILSILFYVDDTKPQNQEPLSAIDDKVWEIHWPGAHRGKRSLDLDLKKSEEQIMERDHELNMKQLQYGFNQLKVNESTEETRSINIPGKLPHRRRIPLVLNIGAFIRKAISNGKWMSTYWTYKGSYTTPWHLTKNCKKYDVGFVLDESGSIDVDDWLKMKDFTKEIGQAVEIGENSGRASIITFESLAQLKVRFNDHLNYNSFARAVDNLEQLGGGTNIIDALNMGLNDMFQTTNGMRMDSEKIVVLITDGVGWNSISKYKDMAAKYQQKNIKLFVVGIGRLNENKLKALVADQNCYFHANNFNALLNRFVADIEENLQGECKACEESVRWVVFEKVLPIAQVQANAFSSLFINNWRPTQPTTAKCDVHHLIHNCLNCECHEIKSIPILHASNNHHKRPMARP